MADTAAMADFPTSTFRLWAPDLAPAHTAATAGLLPPLGAGAAHPALLRDALAASPVFSSRVLTLRLSAPFCCWSPSQSVGLYPFSCCKLCLLWLGLSGVDGKTQEEAG